MAVGVVEFLEMIDVDHHQRQRRAAAIPIGEPAAQFSVEGTAVTSAGQRVGHGVGRMDFDLLGLFLQFDFSRLKLLLHPAIGFDNAGHRAEHDRIDRRAVSRSLGQLLADFLDAAGMLADVSRHALGELVQPRQGCLRAVQLRGGVGRIGRRGDRFRCPAEPPADGHAGQQLDDRHCDRKEDQRSWIFHGGTQSSRGHQSEQCARSGSVCGHCLAACRCHSPAPRIAPWAEGGLRTPPTTAGRRGKSVTNRLPAAPRSHLREFRSALGEVKRTVFCKALGK